MSSFQMRMKLKKKTKLEKMKTAKKMMSISFTNQKSLAWEDSERGVTELSVQDHEEKEFR